MLFNNLSPLSPKISGFLLAIIGTALFSLKSIFIKLSYMQGLNADSVLMLRMAIALPIYAGILIWLYSKQESVPESLHKNIYKIIFLGFIGYFLSSWLDLKGLEYISAQLERLTLFSYPVLVAVLGSVFFKTPLTKNIVLALIITYAGVWVVFNQELTLSGENVEYGTLLVFLAALNFSIYVLMGKKVIHEVGSLWFTSIAMIVSSVFVLLYYAAFFNYSSLVVTAMAWFWLILLAIFSTVIPSFMIAEAIAKIGPAQTGVIGTLGPMITIVLAVVFLNESFTVSHAIGICLVIGGVTVLARGK
ncbi:MAG: EamA/RhaT family transporter [endosymbiont of Galathealinum brachiosum]|uniref:EamA/RhaT family transporter n=1 Tax=endosymbiont of Galathealinum brachiosum TaxID=2200906 RepID=A0A370DFI1_9GAMM|nr:MAG: EamA/RhaT family transporter [endosymbiont of Galathealinum brachiosum]